MRSTRKSRPERRVVVGGRGSVVAAYSGSFDPITLGHTDIIERAARMFPRLIVAVGSNVTKTPKFSIDERVAIIRRVVERLPNVEVMAFSGLVVDFARTNGVTVLVRGVRTVGDLEVEKQMAVMNRSLYGTLDTVMLTPSPEYANLSSSLVRELTGLGAPVAKLVPRAAHSLLMKRCGPASRIKAAQAAGLESSKPVSGMKRTKSRDR